MPTFEGDGISVTGSSPELFTVAKAAGLIKATLTQDADDQDVELCNELEFIDELSLAQFFVGYEPDWADQIIHKCATWRGLETPRWLPKALRKFEWAFLQLPTPDRRYVCKSWNGVCIFPARGRPVRGFRYLEELIETGTVTHRLDGRGGAELVRGNPELDELDKPTRCGSVSGEKLHGLDTQHINSSTLEHFKRLEDRGDHASRPKTIADRTSTCADDFNRQVRDAIDYALKVIEKKDSLVAIELKNSIRLRDGVWKFNDSRGWITSLTDIPYDCVMTLRGDMWDLRFTEKDPLCIKDSVGMRYVARILACEKVPAPAALVAGGTLLNEFLTKPPYRRLFRAMYRRVEVKCNDQRNGEIERAICQIKKLKPEHCFHASDQLLVDSELHKVCGLPTGLVILDAEGLTAVHGLVVRRLAMMAPDDPNRPRVEQISDEIMDGVRFSKMYKTLLEEIQPACKNAADTIRQAVYRLRKQLPELHLPAYERFANYVHNHVTTGEVCEHTSGLRWKVEGIPLLPDTLELAEDHRYNKMRRNRKLKASIAANGASFSGSTKPDWLASIKDLKKLEVRPSWLSERPINN